MATRMTSPVFVGRGHQMELATAALARARAGGPVVVLVTGEAGVGKTRFVHEIAARTRAAGGFVLDGGCIQVGAEGLPFGPFIEALRGLAYAISSAELDELLGAGRSELARLIPHLEPGGEDSPMPRPFDTSAQGRLFEFVLLLLERLGDRSPLLLVIEDLHWADRSTLELLGFLSRNLRHGPIVLLATYRSDEVDQHHVLFPFLGEQRRTGRVEHLELKRFNREDLAAQLEAIAGRPLDPSLVERILVRSQGNAFYAEELFAAGGHSILPESLREVLLARVATLDESTQAFVRVAATGGIRISPSLVARVSGVSLLELEPVLRDALGQHVLIADETSQRDGYAFRHALVQEAVYLDLLPSERTRLHAAFATALTEVADPDGGSSRAAETAHHWQAAHDLPRAFEWWIRAGRAAESIYAFAEAAANFDRALALWDQVPEVTRAPFDHVDVLTRSARAAIGTAPANSVERISAAIALVSPTVEPIRAGLLHERLGQYRMDDRDFGGALAAHEEAVRLVPPVPPSAARAWVLSGLGTMLMHLERIAESATHCREALRIAEEVGDRDAEVRALVPLGTCLTVLGDPDAGIALLRRSAAVAGELGQVDEVARAMGFLSVALWQAGRDEEAATAALEAETYDVRHGLGNGRGATIAALGVDPLLALGRWDEAAEALERTERLQVAGTVEIIREERRALLEALRGRFDTAARSAARAFELDGRYSYWNFRGPTELALWRGQPLIAREIVDQAMTTMDPKQVMVRLMGYALALGMRAEADISLLARARRSKAALNEARHRGLELLARSRALVEMVDAQRPYYLKMATAWMALVEAEFGRLEGRSDAGEWAATAGVWAADVYILAYALMRQGEAGLATRRDRAEAASALEQAQAIATLLRAEPLRIAAETIAKLAPRRRRSRTQANQALGRSPFDLSPREREVLQLIAAGRTDGEIGEALFISRKTASVHVANIKGKLGAASRVGTVTSAIGLGLVEHPSVASD